MAKSQKNFEFNKDTKVATLIKNGQIIRQYVVVDKITVSNYRFFYETNWTIEEYIPLKRSEMCEEDCPEYVLFKLPHGITYHQIQTVYKYVGGRSDDRDILQQFYARKAYIKYPENKNKAPHKFRAITNGIDNIDRIVKKMIS